jgi:transposase InsO family protein
VFIDAEKANFPIVFMCREFGVTRQGYAAWRRRQAAGPSDRDATEAALVEEIAEIYTWSQGRYGAPRVWRELRRRGRPVGRHRVAGLMAANGLVGRSGRRRGNPRTTVADPAAAAAPNIVARNFNPDAPNELWVTDVTYLRTDAGFVFLAAIIDCYSRMVVGWATATHLRTELCLAALDDAVARRRPRRGLVHHSDRGCQYTSHDYRQRLHELGVTQSMSRTGNCWDNAVAESFFSTLKLELIYNHDWASHAELEATLFEYIEVFYNRQRLHSTIDYNTPYEYDQSHQTTQVAA